MTDFLPIARHALSMALFWGIPIVAAVGLIAYFGFARLIASKLLGRRVLRCTDEESPADRGFDQIAFEIQVPSYNAVDGDTETPKCRLDGWLIRPPDAGPDDRPPCVLMVHGFSSHKNCLWTFPDDPDYRASLLHQGADSLCRAGFAVAAIDLRNHGQSDENGPVTLGIRESYDVLATLRYLKANADRLGIDGSRLGLRGESMGGVTSLIAASIDDCGLIAALWCDSTFADGHRVVGDFLNYAGVWRGFAPATRLWLKTLTGLDVNDASPVRYVEKIRCPVMLVHSTGDTMVPIEHFDQLASAAWANPPETWRLAGHRHNRLWKEPDYHQRQIEFFRQHLGA
ncbi:alpha/beta hydrolase family protein [Crateriforma conspicua]|uniref:alpha/beta hydrolase family protein n=1 Tax=Crateriforma conspicua TaxID=2527996 RepID=UPI00118CCB16|nr:alpha/beta fold hydrolase [Crateriforma conspicua]QDV63741.1 Alpha/beta hydrolase family protein [Crateriforma conspicua]